MEQDTRNKSGAPSSDTTSALFVSARKKQLEQQEEERRAREKEDQRLAAEAEVHRLEQEVLERKRKAEEEARQVAQEARAKKAQAAVDPDAVLGAAPQKTRGIKLPGIKQTGTNADGEGTKNEAEKVPMNKKMLMIGGAAAAVLVIVIIIFAVVINRSKDVTIASAEAGAIIALEDMGGAPAGMKRFSDEAMGIAFNYPSQWITEFYKAGGGNAQYDFVMAAPEGADDTVIMVANYSEKYNSYISGGGTDGNALVESLIGDAGLLIHYKISDLTDLNYLSTNQNADGSTQFNASWTFANDTSGYAALAVYEDRNVAVGTVVIMTGEDRIDAIEAILLSTEVW